MAVHRFTGVEDTTGKHLVVNCRTAEVFMCDELAEAHQLAAQHDAESAALAAIEAFTRGGDHGTQTTPPS